MRLTNAIEKVYNGAYIVYYISVVVKVVFVIKQQIQFKKMFEKNNGVLKISKQEELAISRAHLAELLKAGAIERYARGIYTSSDKFEDEMQLLQLRFGRAIYSHETALFLHGLCDRSPLRFSVTVPSGYNAGGLTALGAKVYYIKKELYSEGQITAISMYGNNLQVYDIERTICDVVRSRSKIDEQIFFDGLKMYAALPGKDLNKLMRYALAFKLESVVRGYFEVLL